MLNVYVFSPFLSLSVLWLCVEEYPQKSSSQHYVPEKTPKGFTHTTNDDSEYDSDDLPVAGSSAGSSKHGSIPPQETSSTQLRKAQAAQRRQERKNARVSGPSHSQSLILFLYGCLVFGFSVVHT